MIKSIREKRGLSQKNISEKMNVTQGCVSQWEAGMSKPSADKLPLLAKILGCTIDELFENG